jgi:UDP-N-acetylmuramoyl-tripeptide--D-alanyl-D-alanine ligase
MAKAVSGVIRQGEPAGEFTGVSTDTRGLEPGDLFFALTGEKADGHRYLGEARIKGGSGAVMQTGKDIPETLGQDPGFFLVEVPDTLFALGELARYYRSLYPVPLLAITGSNGKTTTKEMAANILGQSFRVLKNQGNFNNLIGLPLTLFQLEARVERIVVEMGMNHPGEIRRLARIAAPNAGVITNIGPVHLEGVKTLEGVREAKTELLEEMGNEGTAVLNADDPMLQPLIAKTKGKVITFGLKTKAQVTAREVVPLGRDGFRFHLEVNGEGGSLHLPLAGEYNLMNALAATAATLPLGAGMEDIRKGLEGIKTLKGRFRILDAPWGGKVVDDSYNANPASMEAALTTFSKLKGEARGMVILGDMWELGEASLEAHRKIVSLASRLPHSLLFLVGERMVQAADQLSNIEKTGNKMMGFENVDEVKSQLKDRIKPKDWVLIKGSRAMKMDELLTSLMERGN